MKDRSAAKKRAEKALQPHLAGENRLHHADTPTDLAALARHLAEHPPTAPPLWRQQRPGVLVRENVPAPGEEEQTWPTEEDMEAAAAERRTRKRRVPEASCSTPCCSNLVFCFGGGTGIAPRGVGVVVDDGDEAPELEPIADDDDAGTYVAIRIADHEAKMSVVNFAFRKATGYSAPLANKEQLLLVTGLRTFTARPVLSTDDPGADKHRMEKFLHPGTPVRVSRRRATVRFMFHNPEDVRWFKPVELSTKYGRRGRIQEPLGTHGAMKCLFDSPLQQRDTVCMPLYKRVFPKWPADLTFAER
eukprot:XP_001695928.1 predicted protein [Chlamydomonas reinhardtii]